MPEDTAWVWPSTDHPTPRPTRRERSCCTARSGPTDANKAGRRLSDAPSLRWPATRFPNLTAAARSTPAQLWGFTRPSSPASDVPQVRLPDGRRIPNKTWPHAAPRHRPQPRPPLVPPQVFAYPVRVYPSASRLAPAAATRRRRRENLGVWVRDDAAGSGWTLLRGQGPASCCRRTRHVTIDRHLFPSSARQPGHPRPARRGAEV